MKAPVYTHYNYLPFVSHFDNIRKLTSKIAEFCPDNKLIDLLYEAINDLEEASKASMSITKGGLRAGYGIDKAKKAIACDNVIAIVKQVKALKAW